MTNKLTTSTIYRVLFLILTISLILPLNLNAVTETEERFGIQFPELSAIKIPNITEFSLRNGMTFLLTEDRDFPTINITALIKGGSIHDPDDKIGMIEMATELLRTGGTKSLTPEEFNTLLENTAISLSTTAGVYTTHISMNFLSEDKELALSILNDVFRYPRFDEESLQRSILLRNSSIARRNDEISDITGREFMKVVFGDNHPFARNYEYHTLSNITKADIVAYHNRFFRPNNVIVSVTGDFRTRDMRRLLQRTFNNWRQDRSSIPDYPEYEFSLKPSLNLVERKDARQSWVAIGHITEMTQKDDDYVPMLVLNDVLGAPFTGRIFTRIRNQLGLAYAPSAHYSVYYAFPGVFYLMSQTRSDKTVAVINALIEEVERLQEEYITEEELAFAKESFLNSYVFNYDTTNKIVRRQLTYKYWDYPGDFLEQVRNLVDKVTVEDIHRVANEYLFPEKLAILVVGNPDDFEEPLDSLGEVNKIDISIPRPQTTDDEAGHRPTPENIRAGIEVFRSYLLEMGDFDKVNNIVIEGESVEYRGDDFSRINVSAYIEFPDRIRQEIETPNGTVAMVYNRGKTAMLLPENMRMELPREFANELVSYLRSNPIALANNYEEDFLIFLLKEEAVDNRDYYVLSFSDEYDEFLLYVDKETKLPYQSVQLRYDMQGYNKLYSVYEEYREIEGVKYPVRIVTKDENGNVLSESNFNSVKFNQAIPEKTFLTN